ncbi:hypothetical protein LP420_27930 [Massilia sp. B-10]|nr:hypothetical protein LP420_27930 [Massilia sp. B-10]
MTCRSTSASNPTRSIIADLTPEGEARTKGYTWMQTISGFWGVMAYLVGATFGNETLISLGAIVVFAFSVVPMFFIKEQRELNVLKAENAAGTVETTRRLGPAGAHLYCARLLVAGRAVDVRLHLRLHPDSHRA